MAKSDQPVTVPPAATPPPPPPTTTTTVQSLSPLLKTLLMIRLGLATPPAVVAATPPAGVHPPYGRATNTQQNALHNNEELQAYAAAVMLNAEWKRRLEEVKRNSEQQTLLASLADNGRRQGATEEDLMKGDLSVMSNNKSEPIKSLDENKGLHTSLSTRGACLKPRDGAVVAVDLSACEGLKYDTATKKKRTETGSRKSGETATSNTDSSADQLVHELSRYDFLVGKGGHVRRHPGNRRVRDLILQLLPAYRRATSGRAKTKIVDRVIKNTHAHGGRFLEKNTRTEEDGSTHFGKRDASASRKRSYGEACIVGDQRCSAANGRKSQAIEWKVVATSDCRQRLSQRFREEMSGRPQTWRKPPAENYPINRRLVPKTALYLR